MREYLMPEGIFVVRSHNFQKVIKKITIFPQMNTKLFYFFNIYIYAGVL